MRPLREKNGGKSLSQPGKNCELGNTTRRPPSNGQERNVIAIDDNTLALLSRDEAIDTVRTVRRPRDG
jgi:hypothetical protein